MSVSVKKIYDHGGEKKDIYDPGNQDDVITHLEPDIPKCEVKWALGSITTNKASGGDGLPVDLFPVLWPLLSFPKLLAY